MKHIFIHGGPGLNSNPERYLLVPVLNSDKIVFWDEPSILRDKNFSPDHAYRNWLRSLTKFIENHSQDEQVTILAHSFAAFAINDILPMIEDRVAKLVLIGPVFNLMTLDKNILDLAIKVKTTREDLISIEKLELAKINMTDTFNESRFGSLLEALGDEEVLPSYWHNREASVAYNRYFADESFGLDLQSFKAVRESISHRAVSNKFEGKVFICYGAFDPVAKWNQDSLLIEALYPNYEIQIAQNSGHYPHIEEKNQFMNWLLGKQLAVDEGLNRI